LTVRARAAVVAAVATLAAAGCAARQHPATLAPASSAPAPTTMTPSATPTPTPPPDPAFGGCSENPKPVDARAPFPGISARLVIPTTLRAGRVVVGRLVLANAGSRTRTFQVQSIGASQALLRGPDGQTNGINWSDAIGVGDVRLAPHRTRSFDVSVATTRCPHPETAPPPPLAAGTYTATATVDWSAGSRNGALVTAPVTVTVR
jgi:hypothetical protein